ncbi:MAG: type II toxin-antitoxin system VapC family toxin [Gammaproteobacteria bacterium]|nr:type II toxin-antitoxin system VapC family toxin [Gammaproteobacteria bacterium]
MKVIDTCGWIEWLTDGVLSEAYEPYFDRVETLMTPTSVQFELYKWVRRNSGGEKALQAVALTEQTQIIPLTTSIALLAADLSTEHSLSFADAIIYASARFHQARLITSDSHFEGLLGVEYFSKLDPLKPRSL